MSNKQKFKFDEIPFDKRKEESENIIMKYPNRIPIIIEIGYNSHIPEPDKHKFLAPADLTIGQFVFAVRKRIKLRPEQAIFLFINNYLPSTNTSLSQIYEEYKDTDGFLKCVISGESTFGMN